MSSLNRAWLLIAALICLTCASVAAAADITYTFWVTGCNTGFTPTCATGNIGSTTFAITSSDSDELKFTYVGATSNIVPWSFGGTTGYELLGGTATVSLLGSGGAVLASGTFSASDNMFVSIHNAEDGIGLGSAGALPTSSSFPGQPTYPVGFFSSALTTYNLSTSLGPLTGGATNCYGNVPTATCQATGGTLGLTSGASFVFNDPYKTLPPEFTGTFSATVATTSVPEPATLGLIVMGIAGIGAMRGRSRRRNS
jgi:PEP-CTERM motif